MRKIISIVVLAILLKPVFPVVEYVVNYHYISTVLCVNKDKPELKCCGKCHLKKELAKAAESEKPISSDKKDNSKQEIEILFLESITSLAWQPFSAKAKLSVFDNYSNTYLYLNSCTVFHPPTLA
jgi:hypothetical protein